MSTPTELFIILLAVGLLLIALEVFVPGGILGVFGALSLLAAVITGFVAFGPEKGMLAAVGVVLFGGVFLVAWIKVFPRTRVGKTLTLRTDGRTFKSSPPDTTTLLGKTGVAHTHLHPAGIAMIDGHRCDVVSEAGFISQGAAIRVVQVEGNRVVVREVAAS